MIVGVVQWRKPSRFEFDWFDDPLSKIMIPAREERDFRFLPTPEGTQENGKGEEGEGRRRDFDKKYFLFLDNLTAKFERRNLSVFFMGPNKVFKMLLNSTTFQSPESRREIGISWSKTG